MATAETVMAVTSCEDRALESRMRSKDSCPVWGEGAGTVLYWQLADALLYVTSGSEGAGSRQRGPATRHIAMRLQHLKQIANGLSDDDPERAAAKTVIVAEVERLHWRIWNGKAKDAQVSIDRIRTVMHHFKGEPDERRSIAPLRKLWTALQALDGYLTSQSAWLVNYAERHRAGLRVGTAITEGTANFLVNRRMNKSQQMRWSRRGADLLLQVRCAVYNGTLGSGFGQKFQPANDPYPLMAVAA